MDTLGGGRRAAATADAQCGFAFYRRKCPFCGRELKFAGGSMTLERAEELFDEAVANCRAGAHGAEADYVPSR